MSKLKAYPLNISRQIDVNFRNYAIYVLENRGIPSFYDAFTNVQRFIVLNAPSTFQKTISLVGSCISDGYHHGDKSLTGAVNKLARPVGCADQMLLGDGFFGTPINQEAAAARYTSIKLNPAAGDIIKKNSFLYKKNNEGYWEPLWLDLPIGLTNPIIGIAVGYKTTILPRSIKDIQAFLAGKAKEVKPSFIGYSGKITRYNGMDKSWLMEGVFVRDDAAKTLSVKELPPLMRYGSFLKKLDNIINLYPGVKMTNNSRDNVNIILRYNGGQDSWISFADAVERAAKMLITETPVFVKDGVVLEYSRIEDYLTDYQYRLLQLRVERAQHFTTVCNDELEFNRAKKVFLEFMLQTKRTEEEIDVFLSQWDGKGNIKRRLDSIYLKNLNTQELERVKARILELETELANNQKELEAASVILTSTPDPTLNRGQKSAVSSADLFAEEVEIDGIEVFQASSVEEEEEGEEVTAEDEEDL